MRKIALLTALVILFVIPASAQAAEPRLLKPYLDLTYTHSAASITARIIGESASDYLTATIKLWHTAWCVETWEETGYGYINFSETAEVTPGNTYYVTVDWTVNGVPQDTLSVTKHYG